MKIYNKYFFLLVIFIQPVQVLAIDLQCEALADKMVHRLIDEGLIEKTTAARERALAISLESCMGAQQVAQQQQAIERESFIKNWLFENAGGKPGNERLRNLKR